LVSTDKQIFEVFDQPRYAGMKMFLSFFILIVSFFVAIVAPFTEYYLNFLLLWLVLSYFLLLRERLIINVKEQMIYHTIYLWKFKYIQKKSIKDVQGVAVKLFWEDSITKNYHVRKKVMGGAGVFLLNLTNKESIFVNMYGTYNEAKPLIQFCTNILGLEIRDEYQERIDSSKMKRKFGVYN
jgi:hypothetical protein